MRKLLMTLLLLLYTTGLGSSPLQSSATQYLVGSFDSDFRRWTARFIPDWEYPWLKAQCMQESLLDPEAVSSAGAVGLCQFMRPAWSECQKALRHRSPRTDPQASIMCSAWYMQRMGRIWSGRDRTPAEILPIAQSSYNAGAGRIIAAQRQCGGGRNWIDFADCMPAEARNYPRFIRNYFYKFGGK